MILRPFRVAKVPNNCNATEDDYNPKKPWQYEHAIASIQNSCCNNHLAIATPLKIIATYNKHGNSYKQKQPNPI